MLTAIWLPRRRGDEPSMWTRVTRAQGMDAWRQASSWGITFSVKMGRASAGD